CKDTQTLRHGKKNIVTAKQSWPITPAKSDFRRKTTGFSPHQLHSLSVRCPFVVRLLSDCCPINDRTTIVQQTDNERTTNEDDSIKHWR
ncbi:MAG: hypothetical protein K5918_08850, partial [Bacteroidales bacterium]|nr:hypothetical protein [Bacteroidales bacterium]